MSALHLLDVEGDVPDLMLDIELEQFARAGEGFARQNRDDVERKLVLLQQLDAAHHQRMSAAAIPRFAIAVVQPRRPIQADADSDVVHAEKIDPLLREKYAIRLDRVVQLDRSPIESVDLT